MTGRPMVSGGAELALGIQLVPFCASPSIGAGVSARLNDVQVITLSGGGGAGGGPSGFASQDGYVDSGVDESVDSVNDPSTDEDEAESSEY